MFQDKGFRLLIHSLICGITLCHIPMHPGIIAVTAVMCIAITIGICVSE